MKTTFGNLGQTLTLSAALALGMSGNAHAITFDFDFSGGNISFSATGDFTVFPSDENISGFITVDDAAMDSNPDTQSGVYNNAVTDFSISIGSTLFLDPSNLIDSTFFVTTDPDVGSLGVSLNFDSVLFPATAVDFGAVGFSIIYTPGFEDDSIPSADDLDAVVRKVTQIEGTFEILPEKSSFVPGGSFLKFKGDRGEFEPRPSDSIPEPTGAFLFAGGLLVAANALRRSRDA